MSKLFERIITGLIKIPGAKPIEILIFLILLVATYASLSVNEYKIGLFSGLILLTLLFLRGGNKK